MTPEAQGEHRSLLSTAAALDGENGCILWWRCQSGFASLAVEGLTALKSFKTLNRKGGQERPQTTQRVLNQDTTGSRLKCSRQRRIVQILLAVSLARQPTEFAIGAEL
jgi:hypothetical protein